MAAKLGKLLFERAGVGFLVKAGTPETLTIGPYLEEAVLWAKTTGLFVPLRLPLMTDMVVESASDQERLARGWQSRVTGERNPYLGPKLSPSIHSNVRTRAQLLRTAPSMTTHDGNGWLNLKKRARRQEKTYVELAERWARFMEKEMGPDQRRKERAIVYTSLFLADDEGVFGPTNRVAALAPLRNFWPYYDSMIVPFLDNF